MQSWFEEFLSEILSSECVYSQKKNPGFFLVKLLNSDDSPSERQVVNCGQALAGLESSICNILFLKIYLFIYFLQHYFLWKIALIISGPSPLKSLSKQDSKNRLPSRIVLIVLERKFAL